MKILGYLALVLTITSSIVVFFKGSINSFFDDPQDQVITKVSNSNEGDILEIFLEHYSNFCEQNLTKEALIERLKKDPYFEIAEGFEGVYASKKNGIAVSPEENGCTVDVKLKKVKNDLLLFTFEDIKKKLLDKGYLLSSETTRKERDEEQVEISVIELKYITKKGMEVELTFPLENEQKYYMTLYIKRGEEKSQINISPSINKSEKDDLNQAGSSKKNNLSKAIEVNTFQRNNVVEDDDTSLIWKKCVEGVSGEKCGLGKVLSVTWEDAKIIAKNSRTSGHSDWRLPTKEELHSLVYCTNGRRDVLITEDGKTFKKNELPQNGQCVGGSYGRPTINTKIYHNSPSLYSWTSSSYKPDDGKAWFVSFYYGYEGVNDKTGKNIVRLVRGLSDVISETRIVKVSDEVSREPEQIQKVAIEELRPNVNLSDFLFDAAGLFYEEVAPVKEGDKWGLIDKKGNWVVVPKYSDIGRYKEGVMSVKNNELFAFIDSNGKSITDFSYTETHYFSEGLAGVKIRNKWGFINKQGDLKIRAQYDGVRNFTNGYAPVKNGEKWGYIDKNGKWLLSPQFTSAYSFNDGLAVVVLNKKRGYVNTNGKFEIDPTYRRVLKFSEGLAPVSKRKNKWFYVNKKNKSPIGSTFVKVRVFSEELSAVMNDKNKWGYINKTGKLVIKFKYDKAYDFRDGLALVRQDNKRGFIDKNGKIIVPFIYDDAFQFNEGFAPVKKGEKWGYIKRP